MLKDALRDYHKKHHVEASEVLPVFLRYYHDSRTPQNVKDAILRVV